MTDVNHVWDFAAQCEGVEGAGRGHGEEDPADAPPPVDRPCARCGQEIPSTRRRHAKYCSDECRIYHNIYRTQQRNSQVFRDLATRRRAVAAEDGCCRNPECNAPFTFQDIIHCSKLPDYCRRCRPAYDPKFRGRRCLFCDAAVGYLAYQGQYFCDDHCEDACFNTEGRVAGISASDWADAREANDIERMDALRAELLIGHFKIDVPKTGDAQRRPSPRFKKSKRRYRDSWHG